MPISYNYLYLYTNINLLWQAKELDINTFTQQQIYDKLQQNMTKIPNEKDNFQKVVLNYSQLIFKAVVDNLKTVKQKFLVQEKF